MYGHESQPTRVFAYGAKPPKGRDADLIRAQIDAAWRYRNDLVALELERRDRVAAQIREFDPALADLDAAIADIDAEIETRRAAIRRANSREQRKDPPAEAREAIGALTRTRRQLYAEHRALRKETYAKDDVRAALDGADAAYRERAKALRAASGLHWPTYLVVERGLSGIRTGAPPRFVRRADWQGQIAVQVQYDRASVARHEAAGAEPYGSWAHLAGTGHGQVRVEVEPLPPSASPNGRRSRRPYCRLRIRVGSEGRAPVWATVRFVLHRPIPEDGRIKWVYVVRRKRGASEEWSVQFAVARDAWAWQGTTEAKGACAVDLGWRSLEDGSLRVAYAVGEDGGREELVLPAELRGRERKAESLQAIRDREFELARAALERWLATADVPDWLRERTATLAQWRSQARLAALAIHWRGDRFDGDDDAYARLETWRKRDRHLYDWQGASRLSFRRARLELYRRFAARLRWRYETVVVEDADWRKLMRRLAAEEDTESLDRRYEARRAAPGSLRQALRNGHPNVVAVEAAHSTRLCSVCGLGPAGDWDAASEIEYRCAGGHRLDQDRNACANLLARHASGEVVRE